MWLGVRIAGTALAVASVLLFVAGLAYSVAVQQHAIRISKEWWSIWLLRGPPLGIMGGLPGVLLALLGRHMATERRWQRGARRGTAILRNLRPGKPDDEGAHHEMSCALEAQIDGMAAIYAEYRAAVSPLDARWLVEGVALACEANPVLLPRRVRIWLVADPMDRELTGRYLDFEPPR
jgi:hypothetical protein